jgi:hypothetical protein
MIEYRPFDQASLLDDMFAAAGIDGTGLAGERIAYSAGGNTNKREWPPMLGKNKK